jgi:hypothetical protein
MGVHTVIQYLVEGKDLQYPTDEERTDDVVVWIRRIIVPLVRGTSIKIPAQLVPVSIENHSVPVGAKRQQQHSVTVIIPSALPFGARCL